ncbi:flagellin [Colwellia sp. 1_MG-2023]|uniref:flagellin n=1 Tax=unclassified Colwellia TaxID=196834 RepID=UPI001C08B960|nr:MULTISPECIES: flagellin [unclassified Colwellia]MBU2923258.1 flagellin [Colwellia sp. C2M11]MDO6654021.1 flagellin [Colwellia sp. 3_MG-2023]MDO6666969.1 flagellin [Colwellia sp. 2_MG-2023]MDO6691337.1 flagellin [Colwellia sp. 1_MG-2023]
MALSVVTNTASINAQRNLTKSGDGLATSMQRLSSGMRINSAKDDAAGMQIANRLTSQVNGLGVAQRNANDGISMAQTAEGAMQESSAILQRMRDLALQSANGSNGAEDRAALQKEVGALQQELTRIAETTKFGATSLLDGSFGTKQFQVGANANETINVSLGNMAADAIGAYEVNDSATVLGNAATATGLLSATTGAVATADLNINGTDIPNAGVTGKGAADIADTINDASAGVIATAKLDVTLAGLTSADDSTLTFQKAGSAVDTYELASFGGDLDRLAEEMLADGYDAIVEGDTLVVKATDVDGIQMSGTAGTATLANNATGGAAVAGGATNNDISISSTLTLSSSQKIGMSGTDVDDIMAEGTTITATGGTGVLTTVEDLDISGTTSAGAQDAITVIDAALAQIDSSRAALGAVQNRFSHTISNLANVAENVSASRSRIEDTDFAAETATMTKNQILQQAGTTMLSQANQIPQAALTLLG